MPLTDYLFGRPLATDEEGEQRVGVWAGIPMLGLDALGSAAYGPEAALTLLIPLGSVRGFPPSGRSAPSSSCCCWSSTSRTGRRSRPTRTGAGHTPWRGRTWGPTPG